jgi:hypothetical protein
LSTVASYAAPRGARLIDPVIGSTSVCSAPVGYATGHASHVLRRRVVGVIAVLVLSVVAVVLLDAAGFDPRVAAASIGVLACNVFASWSLITQASHGSRRRVPRARPPR